MQLPGPGYEAEDCDSIKSVMDMGGMLFLMESSNNSLPHRLECFPEANVLIVRLLSP